MSLLCTIVRVNVAPVSAKETDCVAVRVGSRVGAATAVGAAVVAISDKVGNGATVAIDTNVGKAVVVGDFVAMGNRVSASIAAGGLVAVDQEEPSSCSGTRSPPLTGVEAASGSQTSRPNPKIMHTRPSRIAAGASHLGTFFRTDTVCPVVEFAIYSLVARIGEQPQSDYNTRPTSPQSKTLPWPTGHSGPQEAIDGDESYGCDRDP